MNSNSGCKFEVHVQRQTDDRFVDNSSSPNFDRERFGGDIVTAGLRVTTDQRACCGFASFSHCERSVR